MLIGLLSAKGSPGVTTTALALTAAPGGGPERLFVELDPAGGDVECWTGLTGEAGLVRVVSDLRRETPTEVLFASAVELPAGGRSLLVPTAGPEAASTIAVAGDHLGQALVAFDGLAIVDAGRWSIDQPTARRLDACAVVGVVCSPTLAGVEHARCLIDALRSSVDALVCVVLVGHRPYPATEVAAAIGVPVAGVMAWDPRGVTALLANGAGRSWARSALARSARTVLGGLVALGEPQCVAAMELGADA